MPAPSTATTPPVTQAATTSEGRSTAFATSCGFMKMPDPTMPPMTAIVVSKNPSCRDGVPMAAHGISAVVEAAVEPPRSPGFGESPERRANRCFPRCPVSPSADMVETRSSPGPLQVQTWSRGTMRGYGTEGRWADSGRADGPARGLAGGDRSGSGATHGRAAAVRGAGDPTRRRPRLHRGAPFGRRAQAH